jgi:hypothetical protein
LVPASAWEPASRAAGNHTVALTTGTAEGSSTAALDAAKGIEEAIQCGLLRHIFGNPFRPYPAPASWPSTIVQLAVALYNGQDCSFALHDALLEAGHGELAEHFKEKDHPKGCWAVDLLLGKE